MLGKFNSAADRQLWKVTLDGMADGEATTADGYFARVGRYILHEDDQGFVTKATYGNEHEAEVAIQLLGLEG